MNCGIICCQKKKSEVSLLAWKIIHLHVVLKAACKCRSVILSKLSIKQNQKDQACKNRSCWQMQLHLHPHPLMNFYCLQYLHCIKLLERLVTSPCWDIEEDYVLKFRKQLPVQSEKHVIEPLKYDEQGVAYSTGEGNFFPSFFLIMERKVFRDKRVKSAPTLAWLSIVFCSAANSIR